MHLPPTALGSGCVGARGPVFPPGDRPGWQQRDLHAQGSGPHPAQARKEAGMAGRVLLPSLHGTSSRSGSRHEQRGRVQEAGGPWEKGPWSRAPGQPPSWSNNTHGALTDLRPRRLTLHAGVPAALAHVAAAPLLTQLSPDDLGQQLKCLGHCTREGDPGALAVTAMGAVKQWIGPLSL